MDAYINLGKFYSNWMSDDKQVIVYTYSNCAFTCNILVDYKMHTFWCVPILVRSYTFKLYVQKSCVISPC